MVTPEEVPDLPAEVAVVATGEVNLARIAGRAALARQALGDAPTSAVSASLGDVDTLMREVRWLRDLATRVIDDAVGVGQSQLATIDERDRLLGEVRWQTGMEWKP